MHVNSDTFSLVLYLSTVIPPMTEAPRSSEVITMTEAPRSSEVMPPMTEAPRSSDRLLIANFVLNVPVIMQFT